MIDLPSPPPDDLLAAAADTVPLAFLDFETTGLYPASGDACARWRSGWSRAASARN